MLVLVCRRISLSISDGGLGLASALCELYGGLRSPVSYKLQQVDFRMCAKYRRFMLCTIVWFWMN